MKSTSFIRFHANSKGKFQFYLFTGLVEAVKVWKGGPNADTQSTEKIYQKFFIKDDNKIKFY